MSRYAAFIDESGNHDLDTDKEGASRYFLVLSVLVNQDEVTELEKRVDTIRARFFGSGEMKSSRVKNDRRIQIIDALRELPFRFYAVAVDKTRLHKDSGLAYKTSFIKFVNGRLYNALFHHLHELTVFADGHGGEGFIESFRKYLVEHHAPDLFSQPRVEIVDSKTHALVQLADFLVGTSAKLYEDKADGASRQVFLDFLHEKRIRIDEWPPRFESPQADVTGPHEMDAQVAATSLSAAARFLSSYEDSGDVELQAQHALLSYLLFRARFPSGEEYVSTQELMEHLHTQGFREIETHYVRSNLVSRLRDREVVIASSARGYKIPTTYADMVRFADLVDRIVWPLLQLLKRANDAIALASAGKADVLVEERFARLRRLLEQQSGRLQA
ncbi:MAG: DUF3800 domain-containing protein [Massilia sp.]